MPDTLITTDQNTGREITWTVVGAVSLPPGFSRAGFTHTLFVARKGGRGAAYSVQAELDPGTGEVIRNSSARRA